MAESIIRRSLLSGFLKVDEVDAIIVAHGANRGFRTKTDHEPSKTVAYQSSDQDRLECRSISATNDPLIMVHFGLGQYNNVPLVEPSYGQ